MNQRALSYPLRRTHRDFGSTRSEIDETVEVCGTSMRCHTARRQAGRRERHQIRGQRAAHEIHAPDDLDEAACTKKARDLSSRQAESDELRSGEEAQLFDSASGEAPFEYDVHTQLKRAPVTASPAHPSSKRSGSPKPRWATPRWACYSTTRVRSRGEAADPLRRSRTASRVRGGGRRSTFGFRARRWGFRRAPRRRETCRCRLRG